MSSSETVLSKRYVILTPGSKQRMAKYIAIYEIHKCIKNLAQIAINWFGKW